MSKKTDTLPNLEASLAEITQLIDNMEHGELSLDQSLERFERGVTLVKHCQKILADAEQKVSILIQKNGKSTLTAYGEQSDVNGTDKHAEDE